MSKSSVRVKAIAKKELVEFVRDWRTILAILIIPLLMFPLLFILFPLLLASEAAELDALLVDVSQHRFEGCEVGVQAGDHCLAHGHLLD